MPDKPDKKTPRDLLRVVFRRWLTFVIGASVFAFAALIGGRLWPPKYTGVARFERRADVASEDLARGKSESFDTRKLTLEQELAGYNPLKAAVEELEKTRLIEPLPRASDGKLTMEGQMLIQELVRKLREALKVFFEVRSDQVDVVSVAFTDRDPRLARALPNTLIRNYILRVSEDMIAQLTGSRDFLQNKVSDANSRLTELMRNRSKFIARYEAKYSTIFPDSAGALEQQVQRALSDIETVRRLQIIARQKLERLRSYVDLRADSPGPSGAPNGNPETPKPETPAEKEEATAPAPKPEAKPDAVVQEKDATAPAAKPDAVVQEKDATAPAAKPEAAAEKKEAPAGQAPAPPGAAPKGPPDQVVKVPNPEVGRLEEDLRQYKRKLDDAQTLAHMTDKHPTVIDLKKKIADLEKRISETDKYITEEIYHSDTSLEAQRRRELQLLEEQRRKEAKYREAMVAMDIDGTQQELKGSEAELERLQGRLAALQEFRASFPQVHEEYTQIGKDIREQEAEVDRWQKRLTEVQMALAAEAAKRRTHLTTVEEAQEQFQPSSPKLLYVLALALLGGLAFSGGLVFLANTLDRSISTTEEAAEHFSLPIYGVVGEIITAQERRRRKIIRGIVGPLASFIIIAALGLATLNVVLWLNYPNPHYAQWSADPVSFLWRQTADLLGAARNWL